MTGKRPVDVPAWVGTSPLVTAERSAGVVSTSSSALPALEYVVRYVATPGRIESIDRSETRKVAMSRARAVDESRSAWAAATTALDETRAVSSARTASATAAASSG